MYFERVYTYIIELRKVVNKLPRVKRINGKIVKAEEAKQYEYNIKKQIYHEDIDDLFDDHEKRIKVLEEIVGGLGPTIAYPTKQRLKDKSAGIAKGEKQTAKGTIPPRKGNAVTGKTTQK